MKKRQTPPVLERSLAGPSSPSPNPRRRGLRDGEVMRLGADNDGERRVLSGNGDLNKKNMISPLMVALTPTPFKNTNTNNY